MKKLIKYLFGTAILIVLLLTGALAAEQQVITAFPEPVAATLVYDQLPEKALLPDSFPNTIPAVLSTGKTIDLPVEWITEEDCSGSNRTIFVYWASWDEELYSLAEDFDYNTWPMLEVSLQTGDDSAAAQTTATTAALTTGVQSILRRAYQQVNIEWTPLKDVNAYLRSDGTLSGVFSGGTTYNGLPYGMMVNNGKYVPFGASFDTFLTAVKTTNSLFYTQRGAYGKRTCPYYGTDCSAFASYCYGISKMTTYGFAASANFTTISGTKNIQIGDCLNNRTSHIVMVTNILYGSDGKAVYYEISQETPPICITSLYSAEKVEELLSTGGYVIKRFKNSAGVAAPTSYSGYSTGILLNNYARVELAVTGELKDCGDNAPSVTVTAGGNVLTEGKDYTVSFSDEVIPGSAVATVKGIGSYSGTAYAMYKITGWSEVEGIRRYFDDGVARTGWQKLSGKWYYFDESGVMQTGWATVDGKRYYLKSTGVMTTGWLQSDGSWYYFRGNGAMVTGWVKVGSSWYYMNDDGVMQTGWVESGDTRYYLNASGAMATGWLKLDGKWYYFRSSGAMATGWLRDGGKWYYLSSDGTMLTGWKYYGGSWYYLKSSGMMVTGWLKLGNTWYYMDADGVMQTEPVTIGCETHTFAESGAWLSSTVHHNYEGVVTIAPDCETPGTRTMTCTDCGDSYTEEIPAAHVEEKLMIAPTSVDFGWTVTFCGHCGTELSETKSPVLQTGDGWQSNGSFRLYGKTAVGMYEIEGVTYYFDESGKKLIGWQEISGRRYYFEADGVMALDWYDMEDGKRYFDRYSGMATGSVWIGNVRWNFDENGVVIGGIV